MKISLALTTYNGEAFLEDQLRSFVEQTRLPDEMVVCDDGSTDRTIAMLEAFAAKAPFPVKIVRNEVNLGSTRNFEKAALLCTGEAIAFADQDDFWLPEKLARCEAALEANPNAGLVFTDATVVDRELNPLGFQMWEAVLFDEERQRRMTHGEAMEVLMERNVVTGACMMFRASALGLVVPFSPLWVHDAWIAMMISLFYDIAIVPEPMMLYRQHGNNQIGITLHTWAKVFDPLHQQAKRDDALKIREDMEESLREIQKPGLWQRVRRTKFRDPFRLRAMYEQFGPICDRMIEFDKTRRTKDRYRMFLGFMAHMKARGYLPQNRLQRIPTILRELFLLRYRRFSPGGILPFGLSMALADVLWDTLIDEKDSPWAKHNQLVWQQAARGEFMRLTGQE
jgi:glycosyltransferase involved in cell wall biosynthesis